MLHIVTCCAWSLEQKPCKHVQTFIVHRRAKWDRVPPTLFFQCMLVNSACVPGTTSKPGVSPPHSSHVCVWQLGSPGLRILEFTSYATFREHPKSFQMYCIFFYNSIYIICGSSYTSELSVAIVSKSPVYPCTFALTLCFQCSKSIPKKLCQSLHWLDTLFVQCDSARPCCKSKLKSIGTDPRTKTSI